MLVGYCHANNFLIVSCADLLVADAFSVCVCRVCVQQAGDGFDCTNREEEGRCKKQPSKKITSYGCSGYLAQARWGC